MFHADIEARPKLALATRRPIEMHVLLDMTPSIGNFSRQLRILQPLPRAACHVQLFNQINLKNGSRSAAALELGAAPYRLRQKWTGKDLTGKLIAKTLSPEHADREP